MAKKEGAIEVEAFLNKGIRITLTDFRNKNEKGERERAEAWDRVRSGQATIMLNSIAAHLLSQVLSLKAFNGEGETAVDRKSVV